MKRFEHEGGAGYKAEFETTDSRILAATLTTIVSGIANILGTSSLDVVQMLAKVTLQEQESLRNAYHKVIDDVVSTNLN